MVKNCTHQGQWRLRTNASTVSMPGALTREVYCVDCGNILYAMHWSADQVAKRNQWRAERKKQYRKHGNRQRAVDACLDPDKMHGAGNQNPGSDY